MRACTNCGATPPKLRRGQFDTIWCCRCAYVMPAEGVPDAPDDLLMEEVRRLSQQKHPSQT